MYKIIPVFFVLLFSNNLDKDKIIVQYFDDESSFIYNNDEYKIIIEGQNNYNDYYVDMNYSLNIEFLKMI